MHVTSIEQAKQILRDYGYAEDEISFALNEGYQNFCAWNEKNGLALSVSEYIWTLVRNTPQWEIEMAHMASEDKIETNVVSDGLPDQNASDDSELPF